MLLAQLTDTRNVGSTNQAERYVNNSGRLRQAVDRIDAETVQPDAVVVTGDATENGTADEMKTHNRHFGTGELPFARTQT